MDKSDVGGTPLSRLNCSRKLGQLGDLLSDCNFVQSFCLKRKFRPVLRVSLMFY